MYSLFVGRIRVWFGTCLFIGDWLGDLGTRDFGLVYGFDMRIHQKMGKVKGNWVGEGEFRCRIWVFLKKEREK